MEFAMLGTFCADDYGLERYVAERVMDQALALVHAMGTTRSGAAMAPFQ
ncbi:hypothetical protein AB0945_43230 [Streptomyces sp. NPDC005474]